MEQRILVVDDDHAIAQGVAILLTQSGLSADWTDCARTALVMLDRIPLPRLVILDVMMPEIDGLALCQAIRQRAIYIPVLILSARDEIPSKILGLNLGADEYMTKPFDPDELIARVRAMLRFAERAHPEGPADNSCTYGPFRLLSATYTVTVGDHTAQLTRHEWLLLTTLLEVPGKVFGRETLLRRIWGTSYLGESRAVDMLVQRLRAKIEKNAATPRYLQTVRGFGYRLIL
ncbi:MAG: response regulator transcription factor, partial [Oscillochloris sp.]|nr:response regulator transcription factor [Oscillochloris sp.]